MLLHPLTNVAQYGQCCQHDYWAGFTVTAERVQMVLWQRERIAQLENERDAYANELALCEQDLRHALTRISELCEQLAALQVQP